MNADAFFVIGREHTTRGPFVCQDYAAVVNAGCVVLADGCSSSPHTDFGARLLCRLAAQHGPAEAPFLAEPLLAPLALPTRALDATVLIARWVEAEQGVRVDVAGDGVVVARRRGGGYVLLVVEFPSGAPRYASYDIDPARRAQYFAEFGGEVRVTRYDGDLVETTSTQLVDGPLESSSYLFPAEDFDLVQICSDGATSFRRPVDGKPGLDEAVPVRLVAEEMIAHKLMGGVFVTRRVTRFLKDCAAKGWHHDDDFAVAGIFVDDLRVQSRTPAS